MFDMKKRRFRKPAITFRLLLAVLVAAVLCLLAARAVQVRLAWLATGLRVLGIAMICFSVYKSDQAFHNLQEERNASQEVARREQSITRLSEELLSASSLEELQVRTLASIYSVTECPSAMFMKAPDGSVRRAASWPEGLLLYPADDEVDFCFSNGSITGKGTSHYSEKPLLCFPVSSDSGVMRVVGILCDEDYGTDSPKIKTIESLLVRCGVAMERFALMENEQRILMEKELEHMRSDFLRTISHDLRTPLTGIIGACSVLEQSDVELSDESRRELIGSVSGEAQWLLRMVENLLSVTRVGSGRPTLNISEQAVEEVLAEVLEKTRSRFPSVELKVTQPEDFLMVPMDPTLIVQVLMNLIDNSVKYAGSDKPIEINVQSTERCALISVRDHGTGLSDKQLSTLFEASAQRSGDSGHGMGLGLSLCRSIIKAHGGEITGENCEDGGAIFTISLPKGEN